MTHVRSDFSDWHDVPLNWPRLGAVFFHEFRKRKLNIKYFGMVAEATGTSEETLYVSSRTVNELMQEMEQKYPKLKTVEYRIAQSARLLAPHSTLSESETALLPPFAGG